MASLTITLNAPSNTSDNTPTITGTVTGDLPPDRTISFVILDSASVIHNATTQVMPDDSFAVDTPPLADGEYTVTATINGVSKEAKGSVYTNGYTISLDKPSSGFTVGSNITGKSNAPSQTPITINITTMDGDTHTLHTTVQSNGLFAVALPSSIVSGQFNISVVISSPSGINSTDNFTSFISQEVPNKPPIANAGADKTIEENESVTLDGSASTDTDGTITKYEWFEGTTSLGVGQTLTKSDFTVGTHNITLKVTDDKGATASDTVVVTVKALPIPNKAPIAEAGNDQTAEEGSDITLNASSSTDSDGTIVKYEWIEKGTILSTEKVFTKKDFAVGTHTVTLRVTDDKGEVGTDTVTITITSKPIVIEEPQVPINEVLISLLTDINVSFAKDLETNRVLHKLEWSKKGRITFTNESINIGNGVTVFSYYNENIVDFIANKLIVVKRHLEALS